MFRVDPSALATPAPWLEALGQSAWSTGAGLGLFLVYSISAREERGSLGDALVTGVGNNLASLVAGLATIPAVFSLAPFAAPELPPVEVLGHRGPGGTGLSMVGLPRLFGELGPAGRFVSASFFAILCCAAFTSLIALLELAVRRIGPREFRASWVSAEARGPAGRWLELCLRYAIPAQFAVLVSWWFLQAAEAAGEPGFPFWRRVLIALRPAETTGIGTCLLQWGLALGLVFALRRRQRSR